MRIRKSLLYLVSCKGDSLMEPPKEVSVIKIISSKEFEKKVQVKFVMSPLVVEEVLRDFLIYSCLNK